MCIIFVLTGLHSCVTVHVTLPTIVRDAMHFRDQTTGTRFTAVASGNNSALCGVR